MLKFMDKNFFYNFTLEIFVYLNLWFSIHIYSQQLEYMYDHNINLLHVPVILYTLQHLGTGYVLYTNIFSPTPAS